MWQRWWHADVAGVDLLWSENVWGLSVCGSIGVYYFCPCCVDSFGDVVHSWWEVNRLCPWYGGVGVGVSGWRMSWGNVVVGSMIAGGLGGVRRLSLSRAGRTFLSPPKGCSSSALGSGKDPPGPRPLSTLPSCVRRKQSWEGSVIQRWKPGQEL